MEAARTSTNANDGNTSLESWRARALTWDVEHACSMTSSAGITKEMTRLARPLKA
jgi:hypothetical protein